MPLRLDGSPSDGSQPLAQRAIVQTTHIATTKACIDSNAPNGALHIVSTRGEYPPYIVLCDGDSMPALIHLALCDLEEVVGGTREQSPTLSISGKGEVIHHWRIVLGEFSHDIIHNAKCQFIYVRDAWILLLDSGNKFHQLILVGILRVAFRVSKFPMVEELLNEIVQLHSSNLLDVLAKFKNIYALLESQPDFLLGFAFAYWRGVGGEYAHRLVSIRGVRRDIMPLAIGVCPSCVVCIATKDHSTHSIASSTLLSSTHVFILCILSMTTHAWVWFFITDIIRHINSFVKRHNGKSTLDTAILYHNIGIFS